MFRKKKIIAILPVRCIVKERTITEDCEAPGLKEYSIFFEYKIVRE